MSKTANLLAQALLAACLCSAVAVAGPLPQDGGKGGEQRAAPAKGEPRTFRSDYEGTLGTSMHLEIRADEATAKKAKAALTGEIERLRKIVSTWDAKSEYSRLAKPCGPVPASAELRAVLHECDKWRTASKDAFNCGVGVLTQLWTEAQKRGSLPTEEELAAARARLGAQPWTIDDAQGTVSFASDLPLTFDALAKGWIIDRALAAAQAAGAQDILLDIGGDLRVTGASRSRIGVADPRQPADNAEQLCELELEGVAVATSGGYARGFDLGGKHWSHIFDPRTGMPAQAVLQATVIAPDAATADALATILNVLTPDAGIALVESTGGCASMVVDAEGKQHASAGWAKHVKSAAAANDTPAVAANEAGPSVLPGAGQLVLDFEIQQAAGGGGREGRPQQGRRGGRGEREGGGGWRRPYVAAWIEDAQGRSVRTLCLWIEKPRWIEDLRRWSRLYSDREDEVRSVTRATRAAGKYELVWDGRGDDGKTAAAGEYTVCLEVVREHGTYQLLTAKVAVDGKEFAKELAGSGVEVKSASVAFRLPAKK